MKPKELQRLGIPPGPTLRLAAKLIGSARRSGLAKADLVSRMKRVVADPAHHLNDPYFSSLVEPLLEHQGNPSRRSFKVGMGPREKPVNWRQWGQDLDRAAVEQMRVACHLPVAVGGALMPDAHVGYGLPIGGVLATKNAVIPYAVGVDIACRMKLTVLDLPVQTLRSHTHRLIRAIETETRFGIGAAFGKLNQQGKHRDHPVMDADWCVTPVTGKLKDKAHAQLGTSGSGNHFVEFGLLTLDHDEFGLEAGTYLALLSHSGSRGVGAAVCRHYCHLAMDQASPNMPKMYRHLAWLDLDQEGGQEYWVAMHLMGRYAEANHALIHHHIARHLGAQVLLDVENHHNFAWRQQYGGQTVIVHRKGATPAQAGAVGVIPGSMASPAYVVRGLGSAESFDSASHGAGRIMSRRKARRTLQWAQVHSLLEQRDVRLLSAGLDEVPFVYKDIDTVMAQQMDLVEKVARFDPKLVKMAPPGERPED